MNYATSIPQKIRQSLKFCYYKYLVNQNTYQFLEGISVKK